MSPNADPISLEALQNEGEYVMIYDIQSMRGRTIRVVLGTF